MMVKQIKIILPMIALCFYCGCAATPEPQNINEKKVRARKEAMVRVLKDYAKAIREDDVDGVMTLLSPRLTEPEQRETRYRVEAVVWLRAYTGYRVLLSDTFAQSHSAMLRRNITEVPVIARNTDGQVFRNTATMVWDDTRWRMLNLPLDDIVVGEALDLPVEEEEKIMSAIVPLMEAVKNGSLGKIMGILPDNDAALVRREEPGFLAGLLGADAKKYSLPADLRRVEKFNFTDWPEPDDKPALAYLGPKSVMAIYEVPYTWEPQGIFDDSLRIEIMLTLADGLWDVKILRMHGKGMPGGE